MKKDNRLMKAVKLQECGKISEAEAIYRKILKSNPADFVCNYQLGVIAFSNNDYITAIDFFERAKNANSGYAPLWYNAGITLGRLGRYQEAIVNLDQAIKLDVTYDAAIKQRESLVSIMKLNSDTSAISTSTVYSEKINRAVELQNQGELDKAEALFFEILAESPSDIPSVYSLGILEITRKNPDKALQYFDRGLAAKPGYAPLWYNRGFVLQTLKQHSQAVESYDKALELDPGYKEAMVNRGAVLVEMKRHKDALLNYEELLKIDPNNDKALCNRAIILTDFKMYDLAIQTFERLLQISPDYDYALGNLSFAKLHACSWDALDKYNSQIIEGVRSGKRVCKSQGLLAISNDPHDHLLCAQIFARHFYPVQEPVWRGEAYDHKKIRIAYISPDFREHPVGHLTAGIFENHDKDKFEIIAISLGIDDNSRLRERMLAAFDKFIDVRQMSSRDVATMMRTMEVDIAVDLGGYTADTRTDILAHRPAPIQVNFLGYSSTMGAEYIDYIIADKHIIPEEYRDCYSEEVVYLPDVYLPTDSSIQIAEQTPSREECGLPETGFIFCSFNHDYKINPAMFDVWMRLLKNVPGSVLWLMKLNESAEQNLRKEAEARGVDTTRIIFATRVPKIEDHLARYRLADLFLDTTPYNAHTTTSDVLRAGLPALTCMGKAFAGRVAGSLLHAVGLQELITHSLDEYENLAMQLAMDPDRLAAIRNRLKENLLTSPLYDTGKYCRNLESLYKTIWDSHRQKASIKNGSVRNNLSSEENKIVRNTNATFSNDSLPINFFTIVLNGEPFIRYHIDVFRHLPFAWHWHIIEGVADLKHDTAWSLGNGGNITNNFHREGLSNDGTSEYIDWLVKEFPENVTVYRKPSGIFWDGKLEMVNAPLSNITNESILWQIDVDEFWTFEQICNAREMFVSSPSRRAAFYWCMFFVAPQLMVSTRNCYSQNPGFEWQRTWRYTPDCSWSSHEPPLLVDSHGKSLASMNPFMHDETESRGLVFQHFAYVLKEQLMFKERYYGYKNAAENWKALQQSNTLPVMIREYLTWVYDETMADNPVKYGVVPIPLPSRVNVAAGGVESLKIVIDGVFFQVYNTGIARVWLSLLQEWVGSEIAKRIVILDRDGTLPDIPGYRVRKVKRHNYDDLENDRLMLQEVCDEEEATLFISTYYSRPTTTRSLLMIHDMIPELINADLNHPMWREKHESIEYASSFVAVSKNSALDLARFFPGSVSKGIDVTQNGFDSALFYQAAETDITEFKSRYCQGMPYYLHVGSRGTYKNEKQFLRAFAQLPDIEKYKIVFTSSPVLEPELVGIVPESNVVMAGKLDDNMLRAAYSGAVALVYPSRHEGFGLPLLEAMACGCPVITCKNSSLTEVGGDSVQFVSPDSHDELMKAMLAVRSESLRALLIKRGMSRVQYFSWKRMASELLKVIVRTAGYSQGDTNIFMEY